MRKLSKASLCVAASVLALSLGCGPTVAYATEGADASDIEMLRKENIKLQRQLKAMMKRLEKIEAKTEAATEKAQVADAKADKAVTVDESGAFKVPGTNTTVKVSGYVKADVLHDFSGRPTLATTADSTASDVTNFTTIPTRNDTVPGHRKGSTRFDARQTRIALATTTPTSYGTVGTLVETDFFGTGGTATTTNSYGLRLRRAYGTFNGFLIGQDWSTFSDTAQTPQTLDFNGPAGQAAIRQAVVRYTEDFKNGHTLAFALENPESDVNTTTAASTTINRAPDMIVAWKYASDWGHVGFRALGRNLAVKNSPGDATAYDRSEWGYGLAASGKWKPFHQQKAAYNKDSFMFLIQGGSGIGRYLAEAANLAGATDANRKLHLLSSWGGNVAFQHYWTDEVRSTFVYGHTHTVQKAFLNANTQKSANSIHANVIWSPVSSVDLGVEYIWGHREVHNGAEGVMNRLQASAAYRF